jgi:sulfofructose kinase
LKILLARINITTITCTLTDVSGLLKQVAMAFSFWLTDAMNMSLHYHGYPPTLPEDREFDLVGLGANACDFLIPVPRHPARDEKVRYSEYSRSIGGQTAVALGVAAACGYRCAYLGGVGDDTEGKLIQCELSRMGLNTEGVRIRAGGRSQVAFILVDAQTAHRTIIWGRSDGMIVGPDELDQSEITRGRIFFTDAQNPLSAARAAAWAGEASMPVIVDLEPVRPGLGQLLPHIDILIADEGFPERATGTDDYSVSLPLLVERTAGALVLVTRGEEGVTVHIEGRNYDFPAFAIEAKNTTGAGDMFHGAFAVACLEGMELTDAIEFSQAAAACKCVHSGGLSSMTLNRDRIERFCRETPKRISRSAATD